MARRREDAYINGTDDQAAALDEAIREHAIHQQIPQRWQLDVLFSWDAYYNTYNRNKKALKATGFSPALDTLPKSRPPSGNYFP